MASEIKPEPELPDPTTTEESVVEFVNSSGTALKASGADGVLRGVKLLGLRSRNGRRYAEDALRRAIDLYEGAKVNVNHPTRAPLSPRDYRDRFGAVRNVRFEAGEGLYGDLHYNPKHPLAEQLAWDASHAPQNVGLSHNVLARTRRDSGQTVVESITRVQSVDLVADPATTSGLFEQAELQQPEPAALTEQIEELRRELSQAQEQVQRLQRGARIDELFARYGARRDDPILVSESFLRLLHRAEEADLEALVADRVRTAGKTQPTQSREQRPLSEATPAAPKDTAAFVEAISRPRR